VAPEPLRVALRAPGASGPWRIRVERTDGGGGNDVIAAVDHVTKSHLFGHLCPLPPCSLSSLLLTLVLSIKRQVNSEPLRLPTAYADRNIKLRSITPLPTRRPNLATPQRPLRLRAAHCTKETLRERHARRNEDDSGARTDIQRQTSRYQRLQRSTLRRCAKSTSLLT
jgi:hypothetical protein